MFEQGVQDILVRAISFPASPDHASQTEELALTSLVTEIARVG